MIEKLQEIKKMAIDEISVADDLEKIKDLDVKYLGRKGLLTDFLKTISQLPLDQRPQAGSQANEVKFELLSLLTQKKNQLNGDKKESKIDVTMPGETINTGHLHLVTQAIREIEKIFSQMGFKRARYPEVEWDYYAFEALNMPADHPARDEWETFFISPQPINEKMGRMLLTPHTSSGQVREMQRCKELGEPVRMMNISKTYRRQIDISHVPMFHQFEGLVVDKDISMTHLKGVLLNFIDKFFGSNRKMRLRPFHFCFTEPSFEIDISCSLCNGNGCSYCKSGWSELGGAGMVHPNVLRAGGFDPEVYSGFAFGWGVERTYMMKSNLNLDDLRLMYSNDIRFLQQF